MLRSNPIWPQKAWASATRTSAGSGGDEKSISVWRTRQATRRGAPIVAREPDRPPPLAGFRGIGGRRTPALRRSRAAVQHVLGTQASTAAARRYRCRWSGDGSCPSGIFTTNNGLTWHPSLAQVLRPGPAACMRKVARSRCVVCKAKGQPGRTDGTLMGVLAPGCAAGIDNAVGGRCVPAAAGPRSYSPDGNRWSRQRARRCDHVARLTTALAGDLDGVVRREGGVGRPLMSSTPSHREFADPQPGVELPAAGPFQMAGRAWRAVLGPARRPSRAGSSSYCRST